MLGAAEKGMGGCIIGNVDRDRLRSTLNILAQYEISMCLLWVIR